MTDNVSKNTRQKPRGAPRTTRRGGMTLVEVMMAITILATAMLAIAGFMAKFAHAVAVSDVRNTASEVASQRLEEVKTSPRYSAIDSLYPEKINMIAPYVGYTRETKVARTGNESSLIDYKTITVIVSNGRLDAPVRRSTIIAAY